MLSKAASLVSLRRLVTEVIGGGGGPSSIPPVNVVRLRTRPIPCRHLWSRDLTSNFDNDLMRPRDACFDASQREKHDGAQIIAPGPRFTNRNCFKNGVGYPENGVANFKIWRYNAIFWGRLPRFWSRYVWWNEAQISALKSYCQKTNCILRSRSELWRWSNWQGPWYLSVV